MLNTTPTETHEYFAEFGIYVNCSIYGTEERTIEATSIEEAKAIAEELADEIEQELSDSEDYEGDDVWVHLDELCEE